MVALQDKSSNASNLYPQCEDWIQGRLRARAQKLHPEDPAFAQGVVNVHKTYVALALEGCCGEASDQALPGEAAHMVSVVLGCFLVAAHVLLNSHQHK